MIFHNYIRAVVLGYLIAFSVAGCANGPPSPEAPSASSTPAPSRPVSLGMAADKGAQYYYGMAVPLGINDHTVVYYTLGSDGPLPYLKFSKDPPTDIISVLKFPKDIDGLLGKITNGDYDDQLREFGARVKSAGRKITLRLCNEFNGSWYSCAGYAKGNKPDDFVPAWHHMVDILRDASGGYIAAFDLNYNRSSADGRGTKDFALFYPGDDYVDSVSISTYNRCGADASHTTPKSAAEELRPAYQAVAAITHKPIWIAEISTTDFCGVDKIVWFHDLYAALETEFVGVTNVTFFFGTVAPAPGSSDKPLIWGLADTIEVWKQFRAETDQFRASLHLPTPPPAEAQNIVGASGAPRGTVTYPWTVSGSMTYTAGDEPNDEISGVTGEEYGQKEGTIFLRASQGIQYSLDLLTDSDTIELRASMFGGISSNPNRYWDNVVGVGLELPYCLGKPGRPGFAAWGNTCLTLGIRESQYIVDYPERYSGGRDFTGTVSITTTFGGDWSH